MADDLSLLFRIRGDAAGAKQATAETRAAVAQLKSSLGSEFNQIQRASQSALASVGQNLNVFVGQRIPLIGGSFVRVTENLRGFGDQAKKNDAQLAGLNKTIDGLSTSTGKSRTQITSFLQSFVQLGTQAKRDAAVIEAFGVTAAQKLIPQLEKAGAEMATVAVNSGTAGSSIGALAGPIGIAVLAIAAITVGAAVLSKQLLDLVVSTAAWQGKLHDLSQQTGVSVETLSALDAIAQNTGSSIEAIAASLGIFQKHLEESLDPASKMAKLFNQLGVETLNTEDALSQTITALAKMPEGYRQTATALELFGRGGKAVLAILKETGGDLDATKEKLRALGILLDPETSRAADAFNDQLNTVQLQLRATTALLVREVTPMILTALKNISRLLVENRQTFQSWGTAIADILRGTRVIVQSQFGQFIKDTLDFGVKLTGAYWVLLGIKKLMEYIRGVGASVRPPDVSTPQQQRASRFDQLAQRAMDANAAADLRAEGKGGGSKAAKDTGLDDATKEAELAERELRQRIDTDVAENKRALEEQARDIEEFTRRAIELAEQRHDAIIVRINAEIAALDQALAKKLISQKEYNRKNRELDIENAEAAQKFADEKWELEQKRAKEVAIAELNAHKRSAQMAEEASDRLIQIIRDKVDRWVISESEGEKQITELIAQGFERRKKLLEDELTRITTSLERKAEINQELINLDRQRADAAEDAAKRIKDAQESERPQRPRRIKDQERPRRVEPEPIPPDPSIWGDALDAIRERMKGFHEASRMYVVDAFNGMADAATSAIEAWILYGGSLGKALKQALAAELAHIAAQAAVQAALHAAYALGSLAFGNAAAAAAHGIAALKFLAVAALTGIAARGLVGSAAQSGSSVAGGAFQSATRVGSGSTAGQPTTTDVNRRANAQPTGGASSVGGELVVKIRPPEGWLGQEFRKDYTLNGVTRLIIKSDGQG